MNKQIVETKGPWPCKCNNCGTRFAYKASDGWLDKGGPVLCQKCK